LPVEGGFRQYALLDDTRDHGLLSLEDLSPLQEAYKALRAVAHRQALQKQPGKVAGDPLVSERRTVGLVHQAFWW